MGIKLLSFLILSCFGILKYYNIKLSIYISNLLKKFFLKKNTIFFKYINAIYITIYLFFLIKKYI